MSGHIIGRAAPLLAANLAPLALGIAIELPGPTLTAGTHFPGSVLGGATGKPGASNLPFQNERRLA